MGSIATQTINSSVRESSFEESVDAAVTQAAKLQTATMEANALQRLLELELASVSSVSSFRTMGEYSAARDLMMSDRLTRHVTMQRAALVQVQYVSLGEARAHGVIRDASPCEQSTAGCRIAMRWIIKAVTGEEIAIPVGIVNGACAIDAAKFVFKTQPTQGQIDQIAAQVKDAPACKHFGKEGIFAEPSSTSSKP